jgi:hypothetical protein
VDIERNHINGTRPPNAARAISRTSMASAAGLALDRMGALAEEADPVGARVTTATALFALCDMARARMFQGTRIIKLFEETLAGRWSRLATERARYMAGRATDLEERTKTGSRLSTNAEHALSIARMLAGHQGMARPLMVEDIVLGVLLCTSLAGDHVAAHVVLQRLELLPTELLTRFAELARA